MLYTIQAHPTTYAGVNFRSRLEARWAAFFDLCQWEWDYEPIDLIGWSPDFILKGEKDIIIEVKPVSISQVPTHDEIRTMGFSVTSWVENENVECDRGEYYWKQDVLLLGTSPWLRFGSPDRPFLGVFLSEGGFDGMYPTAAEFNLSSKGAVDFRSEESLYRLRMSGEDEWGDKNIRPMSRNEVQGKWKEAGNLTKFRV